MRMHRAVDELVRASLLRNHQCIDADPNSTYLPDAYPDADPNSDFLIDVDPDPTFHPDEDPDLDPSFKK
jgi:hypothetical protein